MPEETTYEQLMAVVARHTEPGSYIYAAPDCPEVYFLTGMKNPTGTLFDQFDAPEGRSQRILQSLEENDVRVVVINLDPEFSPPISGELKIELSARYPRRRRIQKFLVLWRG